MMDNVRTVGVIFALSVSMSAMAATYYVDGASKQANDANSGSSTLPWKTLSRAGQARELKPGDEVIVKGGLYRDPFLITVNGEKGKPILFRGAPGEWVELRGSDVLPNNIGWVKYAGEQRQEPYPGAYRSLWKCKLGPERLKGYDLGQRRATQHKSIPALFLSGKPLQMIGPDPGVDNKEYLKLNQVGLDYSTMYENTFYYDAEKQELWYCTTGDPRWPSNVFELSLRQILMIEADYVTVSNLNCRFGGGAVTRTGNIVEDCSFTCSPGQGLFLGYATNCVIRRCDLSWNGQVGLGLHKTEDVVVEYCKLNFNNWRKFCASWHAGGMKNVPGNKRTIVRYNEAAYNVDSPGIWFDIDNVDCEITGNVVHHNSTGIFYEISPAGGLIAGNLSFGNFAGIMVSGSSRCLVAYNTSVDDVRGICVMGRQATEPVTGERVANNLILNRTFDKANCMLMLDPGPPRANNVSDHNFFGTSTGGETRLRQNWNDNLSLTAWRTMSGQDMNSREGLFSFATRSPDGVTVAFPSGRGPDSPSFLDRLLHREAVGVAGLDYAAPQDFSRFTWRPRNPSVVGCGLYRWPSDTFPGSRPLE